MTITESDLRQIRTEFARMGGHARAQAMSKADRREAALKMVKAKAEKRLARKQQQEESK